MTISVTEFIGRSNHQSFPGETDINHSMSGHLDHRVLLNIPTATSADNTSTDNERILIRVANGLRSNKYKDVDYDQLKARAQEMKFNSNRSLIKMKKIEKARQDSKEHTLLQQHKVIWQKEFVNLNAQRRRLTAELGLLTKQGLNCEFCCHLFEDIEGYDSKLSTEFNRFKVNTVNPIWELREELAFWISEMLKRQVEKKSTDGELGKPEDIQKMVASVHQQMDSIQEKLLNEQISCSQELESGYLKDLLHKDTLPMVGIPEDILGLACPDEQLRISFLQEFLLLDQKYAEKLAELDCWYQSYTSSQFLNWSEEDHSIFEYIIDQHPYDFPERRKIYIDRLLRQWPNRTRQEIVEHEDVVFRRQNYLRNRKSLVNDWYRDRKEWKLKCQSIFSEVCDAYALDKANEAHTEKHRELCALLYEKVKEWREEKMEAMELQQKVLAEEMSAAAEKRQAEENKIKKKREKEKHKIHLHHEKMKEERQHQAELDKRRLDALKVKLAEQALHDADRVKFREQLEAQKARDLYEKEAEAKQRETEKEARLEALREKVRVTVEADPYRLVSDTENWANRLKAETEADININQPLFDIHTFTASQISSDPRVRLEQRLREAGLHQTGYARQIMSSVKPLHPPRKDTLHTLRFGD